MITTQPLSGERVRTFPPFFKACYVSFKKPDQHLAGKIAYHRLLGNTLEIHLSSWFAIQQIGLDALSFELEWRRISPVSQDEKVLKFTVRRTDRDAGDRRIIYTSTAHDTITFSNDLGDVQGINELIWGRSSFALL